jgi:hypothetical protein
MTVPLFGTAHGEGDVMACCAQQAGGCSGGVRICPRRGVPEWIYMDDGAAPCQGVKSFQCPSETTSTLPSVTLMAVWSSIAYVGAGILAAHCSAIATSC